MKGRRQVFKYEGVGAFGELALMYNCPRAATVQASVFMNEVAFTEPALGLRYLPPKVRRQQRDIDRWQAKCQVCSTEEPQACRILKRPPMKCRR